MKLSCLICGLFLLMPTNSQAQISEEPLQWSTAAKKTDKVEKKQKKATDLEQQKILESNRDWKGCSQLAPKNIAKNAQIKGWIYLSWLRCSRTHFEKKKQDTDLLAALQSLDKSKNLLFEGPWRRDLGNEFIRSHLLLLDFVGRDKPVRAWQHINALLSMSHRLDKDQNAKIYFWAAELAQLKHQIKAAKFFLEESLEERENKAAREKLNSLLLALNERKLDVEEPKIDFVSGAESRFEERFKTSLKNNDLFSFLEDGLAYLNQFPNGLRQKWVQEKIFEVYQNIIDSAADEEKSQVLKAKAISILLKADHQRLFDWSRQFHRKGDYLASLKLGEKAYKKMEQSPNADLLLYVLGRSAQFLGEYKEAQKYFETYAELHAGADDLAEVNMRLALVYFRMKQYSSSIAIIEKILSMRGGEKYELTARYWLVRALQQTQNGRAQEEVETIQNKFPYSYYGLRLDAERSNNTVEKNASPLKVIHDLKGSLFLLPNQKASWDRIQILISAGWSSEVIGELQELPSPKDGESKIIFAEKLAKGSAFPVVIKLINEGLDLAPEYRSLDILSVAFPKSYDEQIKKEAAKYNLSPYLVRSLIRQESAFGVRAISTSSAIGLMQMIPPTAVEIGQDLKISDLSVPDDVFSPDLNIQMGTYYLSKVIKDYNGNVAMGLAAYNAGPTRLRSFVKARGQVRDMLTQFSSDPKDEIWIDELPWGETSFYVKAILRNVILYQLLDEGRVQLSPVIWQDLSTSVK